METGIGSIFPGEKFKVYGYKLIKGPQTANSYRAYIDSTFREQTFTIIWARGRQ